MLREAALALFVIAVALGLWLADVRPLVVVGVMLLALAVAWVIEWFSWREDQLRGSAPVLDSGAVEAAGAKPAAAPRARGLWLLRGERAARAAALQREPVDAEPAPAASSEQVGAEPVPAAPSEQVGAGQAPQPAHAATEGAEEAPPAPAPAAPASAAPAEEPPPSRRRLQPVRSAAPPPPPPETLAPPPTEVQGAPVVPLWARSAQPREWNLWDLERIARAQSRGDPDQFEEWSYVFLHLRRFATADGMLPAEFDGLVRDYFGGLLEPAQGA